MFTLKWLILSSVLTSLMSSNFIPNMTLAGRVKSFEEQFDLRV